MKISKLFLPLACALCVFAFLGQSTSSLLADGLQQVSLVSSPDPILSPSSPRPRVGLVAAACVANHLGCSSDAECCSQRCVTIRTGTRQCVGKRYR